MLSGLKQFLDTWITRRHQAQHTAIELHRRRVYILPTGYGYAFAAMLMVMLLWAINYNNSLSFALTFLLGATALNAMWRTNDNLLDLRIHPASVEPRFVGETAHFSYRIDNPGERTRYGIALQWQEPQPQYADIPARGSADIILSVPATRRGLLRLGRLRVLTRFPLGLFQAWSWVALDQNCLIYPKPRGKRPLPIVRPFAVGAAGAGTCGGSEDYIGLRNYAPGDSPRHVAWKAATREGGLLVKRFTAPAHSELWLDWNTLSPDDVETRLSQLCQWVLKAEAEGWRYGLRLPGREFPPARGESQRRRCLEALALFGAIETGTESRV